MTDVVPSESASPHPPEVLVVSLPAVGVYLSVLRTTTASVAARLDFTLEEIEDLKIAVDEACAMLLVAAEPGGQLVCRFEVAADAIDVSVTVDTRTGELPSRQTFAWTVLSALAGGVDSEVDEERRVTVRLSKRRAERTPAVR
jgi:serine/threonine-protein kinase RsbW